MAKKSTLLSKTLVFGVMLLFIGTYVVPIVNSIQLKEDLLSNNPTDNSYLWIYPEQIQNDITNSFNIWTSKPQGYRTTYNKIKYFIKSYDSNFEKKSSLSASNGNTLYVGGTGPGNYSRIQAAIDAASDGDTVFVYSRTYYVLRNRIKIDKSINLIGENKETTIIDGGNYKPKIVEVFPIIRILADGVTVSGFTIQNCGGIMPNSNIGLSIRSSHNTISGNIISNNNYGIIVGYPYTPVYYNIISDNLFYKNGNYGLVVADSNNNIISDNVFQNDNLVVIRSTNNIVSDNIFYDDGVWVSSAFQNTFVNNLINDKPLVYLEDEAHLVITEDAGQVILINCLNITVQNKDLSNTAFGIILEGTYNCHISGNNIESDKLGGINLQYSNENNISNNVISDTNNGIVLANSFNNIIFSNTINFHKGFGTYLAYSNTNTISQNIFLSNNAGLILTGGADNNNVEENIFINDGGIWVYGAWSNNFLNNSLNDKPIIYLEDQSDMLIDDDVGQVILVSCDNIVVENQDLSDTYAGIMIVESDNCKISNSSFNNHSRYGIFITHSNNNNISGNVVINSDTGIALDVSENNMIFWNTISSNKEVGIYISFESNGNTILSNNIKENGGSHPGYCGSIFIDRSFDNEIRYNNFIGNIKGYCFSICSSNKWKGNYWDRSRILPKLILGFGESFHIWFTIDWHPAKEPYDI